MQTPDWVRNAVFYQIFPDRFARSEKVAKPTNLEAWESPPTRRGLKGGDFVGMLEHLDYIVDLGVNAIYFNAAWAFPFEEDYTEDDFFYPIDDDPIEVPMMYQTEKKCSSNQFGPSSLICRLSIEMV